MNHLGPGDAGRWGSWGGGPERPRKAVLNKCIYIYIYMQMMHIYACTKKNLVKKVE